ncbi:DUF6207 family protein [Streptomyces sp. NPDC023588]|uniref:DUF6207 family protein n=1 Tax=Streptomyces sp. NPDC023588 TaxID=3154907 RepID=UPI0033C25EB7
MALATGAATGAAPRQRPAGRAQGRSPVPIPRAGGPPPSANRRAPSCCRRGHEAVDEQHIAEPGLVVLDITGEEDTVRAVMAALEERWATLGISPVRREPGVRAGVYADVLRPGRERS